MEPYQIEKSGDIYLVHYKRTGYLLDRVTPVEIHGETHEHTPEEVAEEIALWESRIAQFEADMDKPEESPFANRAADLANARYHLGNLTAIHADIADLTTKGITEKPMSVSTELQV